jgi:hypothetical protein
MSWPTSNPIARELEDFWQQSQSLFQQWWFEANLDLNMVAGNQTNNNYAFGLNAQNRKDLTFNKILRVINMIDGFQRDHRLANIIKPADNDPDMGETADQRSTVNNWVMNQTAGYENISESFRGSLICGLNLQSIWMDFREDPENGKICIDRLPYNSFLMDPYWTKKDLSDCNRIWTRKYITRMQLDALFPNAGNSVPALQTGYASMDGKFQYLAQNWYQYNVQMYAYDEYWVRDWKDTRKLLDTRTGEVAPWNGTKEQFQLLMRINPNVKLIKARIPTIKLCVLVNNNIMYEEKSPYGLDRMPFVPHVCYMFPEVQNYSSRFMGIPRNIRDSQIELNRRRNRLLDMLDAQIQSGLMVKEDALVNPEDAFLGGPGKALFFKNTSNLATDVKEFMPPPVGQGWLELIQTIEKEIMDIVGPEELFAQNLGAKEMSGVLMKMKMGAGLTGLRSVFDNLNESQKNLGENIDDLVINNFGEGKVAHIIGKKPTEHFFEKEFSKFSCVVEEGELTSTQRQYKFLEAIQLKQIMPTAIPDDYIIELSTLQDKKRLVETQQKAAQEQAQLQQAQTQQAMEQQEILTRSLEAKAQSDFASAKEKEAKTFSNIALGEHHEAMAVQDRANAALANAKAMKEIEEMDENHLMKLAKFMMELQERQKSMDKSDALHLAEMEGSKIELAKIQSELSKYKQPQPSIK